MSLTPLSKVLQLTEKKKQQICTYMLIHKFPL